MLGIARSVEFLSLAAISKWCESQSAKVYDLAASEQRIEAQITARLEWKNAPKPQSLIQKTSAWLNRTDPVAQAMSEPDRSVSDEERKLASEKSLSRRVSEIYREWGGEAPTIGGYPVSKELVATLKVSADADV